MNDKCGRCGEILPIMGLRRCYGAPTSDDDDGNICYAEGKVETNRVVVMNRYCGSKYPHKAHEHSMVAGKLFRCRGKEVK